MDGKRIATSYPRLLARFLSERGVSAEIVKMNGAVELAPIAGLPGKRAFDVFMDCYHRGVLVRNAGDNLVFAPPYIVEKSQIETMVGTLADAIKRAG